MPGSWGIVGCRRPSAPRPSFRGAAKRRPGIHNRRRQMLKRAGTPTRRHPRAFAVMGPGLRRGDMWIDIGSLQRLIVVAVTILLRRGDVAILDIVLVFMLFKGDVRIR